MKQYIIDEQTKSNLISLLTSAIHLKVPFEQVNQVISGLYQAPEHVVEPVKKPKK